MKSITLKSTAAAILLTLVGTTATLQTVSADNLTIRAIPGLKLITMENLRTIRPLRIMTCQGRRVTIWGTQAQIISSVHRDKT